MKSFFSSDSDEYLEIASDYTSKLIKRDKTLSDDNASTESVMIDSLRNFLLADTDDIMLTATYQIHLDIKINKFLAIIESGSESTLTVKETHPFVWEESEDGLYELFSKGYKTDCKSNIY